MTVPVGTVASQEPVAARGSVAAVELAVVPVPVERLGPEAVLLSAITCASAKPSAAQAMPLRPVSLIQMVVPIGVTQFPVVGA